MNLHQHLACDPSRHHFMTRLATNATSDEHQPPLSLPVLQDALAAVDPAVVVVSPRILRRVIKQDAGVPGLGLRVPHRKTYVIDRDKLLSLIDRADLDVPATNELPERLILIARPSSELLEELSASDALLKCWRLVFHAKVHFALDERVEQGKLTDADVRSRIQEIGQIEFEEIRTVLRQEEYLLPPHTELGVYLEFAAVYLELRYFVPGFLRNYFPGIQDFHRIDALLAQDVNGEALLTATRPPGAPDPSIVAEVPAEERVESLDDSQPLVRPARVPARERSNRAAEALNALAEQVARQGNLVRAAILRTRASRSARTDLSVALREQARGDMARLVVRLQAALSFSDKEADEWTRTLGALLELAVSGYWTTEARVLYDLQKVCVDHERGVYTLDVFGWLGSLGKKPLKRFLPGQRDVLMSKHLRSAERRLAAVRLTHRWRSRVSALLAAAVYRAETNLRARFKPVIERALDKVKLLPVNPPEKVGRKKLVDEILDRIVERGFLSMGDLRDALSRNNLKLPDLASAQQFLRGDQLIRADRQLAETLDGVYRGGEVYLRFPQRLSSLAFGTPLGRFLTQYVAIPFGGAFLILEGLSHLINPFLHVLGIPENVHLFSWFSLAIWGCWLLGLIHSRAYRRQFVESGITIGRGLRRVFVEVPRWIANLPLIQELISSRPFQIFQRYVFKPLLLSVLLSVLVAVLTDGYVTWISTPATFIVASLLLNSRIGRNVDEMVTDWAMSTWHRLRIHVFTALVRWIMDSFHRLLEAIERLLYSVDEYLRFRAGERRSVLAFKAALASVWFFVNYVIRFLVTLMIEPQINPIKHFPVVTVSHKLLLPLVLTIHLALEGPLGNLWAWSISLFIQFLFPGMFGFLVWELKENWRLYAANRPANLRPAAIGHHGETMVQFLRPGFRSGTIPKLYARLRRSSRKAYWTGDWKTCRKQLEALHHVSDSIAAFTERELVETLRESRSWADHSLRTGKIHLANNRILVELYCPELSQNSLWLSFEEQQGWLVADIHERGWLDHLAYAQRQAFASALAGFYKLAGVDLVREQIESQLEASAPGYEITEDALVVWPRQNAAKLVFPLRTWPAVEKDQTKPAVAAERARWVFCATPISWRRWVVTWELDQLGTTAKHQVLEEIPILPA